MNVSWDDTPGEPVLDHCTDTSVLSALDMYRPSTFPDEDLVQTALFTAANPSGSVAVTVLLNGQILRVELAPDISMTEAELGAEVVLIASLAQMQARAGIHTIVAALMRLKGRDPAHTASILERNLGFPSPSTLAAERVKVLASCHVSDE